MAIKERQNLRVETERKKERKKDIGKEQRQNNLLIWEILQYKVRKKSAPYVIFLKPRKIVA